jgi:hypothetical protein
MAATKTAVSTAELVVDKSDAECTPLPKFKTHLLDTKDPKTNKHISVKELMKQDKEHFEEQINAELRGERIALSDVPDIESLTKLFSHHVMSKGYYERSEELYRSYLSFLNYINLMNQQAHEIYNKEVEKASLWVRENKAKTLASYRAKEERDSYIMMYVPSSLTDDLFWWDAYLSQVKTNLQIIKSYRDEFKFSCADSIAIQHRIINTLIEVGNLKIDPEVVRAMRMVESAYRPTYTDVRDKIEDTTIKELNIEEGSVTI